MRPISKGGFIWLEKLILMTFHAPLNLLLSVSFNKEMQTYSYKKFKDTFWWCIGLKCFEHELQQRHHLGGTLSQFILVLSMIDEGEQRTVHERYIEIHLRPALCFFCAQTFSYILIIMGFLQCGVIYDSKLSKRKTTKTSHNVFRAS